MLDMNTGSAIVFIQNPGSFFVFIQYPASIIMHPVFIFFPLSLDQIYGKKAVSGRSAAWIAHLPWAQGVGGSNPLAPTIPINNKSQ